MCADDKEHIKENVLMIKYPNIKVKLSGKDGNAFAIMARVKRAMRDSNVPIEERNIFYKEATSGDYNHLLSTCAEWVTIT